MFKSYIPDFGDDISEFRFSLGVGENTFGSPFTINPSEARHSRNLGSGKYPALEVRPGMDRISTGLGIISAIGERNNTDILIQDNGSFAVTARVTADYDDSKGSDIFVFGGYVYIVYIVNVGAPVGLDYGATMWLGKMAIDGTGWTTVELPANSETGRQLRYPHIFISGTTVYYSFIAMDASGWGQIHTATSDLDGSTYSETKRSAYTYVIREFSMIHNGGYFYFVCSASTNAKFQIFTAKMALNGTGYSDGAKTSSLYHKVYPRQVCDGTKVYYIWSEYDGSYYQIWVGEQLINFASWSATKKTTSSYEKLKNDIVIIGTQLYYVWQQTFTNDTSQLVYATMAAAGTGWTSSILTTKPYQELSYLTLRMVTDDSNLFYVWYASQMMLGVSNLDGTGFSNIMATRTTDGPYYLPSVVLDTGVLYLTWENNSTASLETASIAVSCNWKRWETESDFATIQAGLSFGRGRIRNFNTAAATHSILMNGHDRYGWDGTTVTDLTEAPYSDKFACNATRVFAIDGKTLYWCALGDHTDWTTASDAGTWIVAEARSDLTAIADFDGYIIVWDEQDMYRFYGSGPADFQLKKINGGVGCIADWSVCTVDGRLFWAGYDGFYTLDGGKAVKMSDKMDLYFKNLPETYAFEIASEEYHNLMYVSIPYVDDNGNYSKNNLTLVYDVKKNAWYPDDNSIFGFVARRNEILMTNYDGEMWKMRVGTDDEGSDIEWEWESGPITKRDLKTKKTLSDLWIIYDLAVGAELNIYISDSVDSDDWQLAKTISGTGVILNGRVQVPTNISKNEDFMRIKFAGSGYCAIYEDDQKLRLG